MAILRQVLLTFRMHRFEVLFATGLMTLTLISALIAMSHATAATPSLRCWDESVAAGGLNDQVSSQCRRAFRLSRDSQRPAEMIHGPISMLIPWIVGLTLGVPVVGRELEMRTATLAWSLSGRRARWLLARLLPMLAVGVIGMALVGAAIEAMSFAVEARSRFGPGRSPELGDLGHEGITIVSRTVAIMGVGLFTGAVLGRTMVAFTIGLVLSAVLFFGLGDGLQAVVGSHLSVPVDASELQKETRPYSLRSMGESYIDASGSTMSHSEVLTAFVESCPRCGASREHSPLGQEAWGDRHDAFVEEHYEHVYHLVPGTEYRTFEAVEAAVGFLIGGAFILLTFPVVARKRP